MTEYVVKLAFLLRASDSVAIKADADAEAIDKAKVAAKHAQCRQASPSQRPAISVLGVRSPRKLGDCSALMVSSGGDDKP